MSVERRVAVVTGSATGIGRAVALDLAKAGFGIAVNYSHSEGEAERTVAEIEALGADVIMMQADVASDRDCQRLIREVHRKWGRVDVLVNNAAFTHAVANSDLNAITDEDWDRTFAVNVKGPFYLARACAEKLRESHGCIVNVSSTAGLSSVGSSIPYSASKASLNNLTLALARALAPNVRVNAVLPGYVETRWNERTVGSRLAAVRNFVRRNTLLGDVAHPRHVAEAVCSLILGMSWVTGELIVVDGGFRVGR
jgi:3-oxoacyl-[acyl-carrier protein] reductase